MRPQSQRRQKSGSVGHREDWPPVDGSRRTSLETMLNGVPPQMLPIRASRRGNLLCFCYAMAGGALQTAISAKHCAGRITDGLRAQGVAFSYALFSRGEGRYRRSRAMSSAVG